MWRSFWRVRGARNGGGTVEGGQRSSGGGGALLSSAACSARARKGNGEAKSDLAIATATMGLSGGVIVGTATRGVAGPVRRRRGKTGEAQ